MIMLTSLWTVFVGLEPPWTDYRTKKFAFGSSCLGGNCEAKFIQALRAFRRARNAKKNEIGPRDVEIRVRSVRFTPKGFEKKVKGNFVIFRSVVTWAWWLVFEEAGCGGWFLVIHGVLAGF